MARRRPYRCDSGKHQSRSEPAANSTKDDLRSAGIERHPGPSYIACGGFTRPIDLQVVSVVGRMRVVEKQHGDGKVFWKSGKYINLAD
jgi:hypothetical protein